MNNACRDNHVPHLYYLPHGESREVCARCQQSRPVSRGKPPEDKQPAPRPFVELECE